jgi:hypothetical protein
MRKTLTLLAALLLAAAAPAADPKIVGADQPVPLGELVSLSVTPPDDPKTPNPVVTVKYDWSVFEWDAKKKDFVPKRVKVDLDGGICFGAGIVEKKLLVHCAVTVITPVKDKDGKVTDIKTNTFLLSATVTIGDGGPAGPAGPPPTPPDVTPPDVPRPPPAPPEADPTFDGKWGPLSKLVWKAAKDIDPAARRKAKDLAAAFRKTADQIKAGALKGQKAILAAAKQADDAALGDQADSWDPVSEALADALLKLANAGQLAADADFESAFRAVADGLEKVK